MRVVFAASGISSKACDIYLNEISKRLRQKGHEVWLVSVNPEKVEPYQIPIYWNGPRYKNFWVFYALCPHLQDRTISKLIAKAISSLPQPIDIVNMEIPSLLYCYKRKKGEKVVVRGWYYPHNVLARLLIMRRVAPRFFLQKIFFFLRQFWFYWGDEYGYRHADAIVTLTQGLAQQLSQKGFNTTWVPLGISVPPLPNKDHTDNTLITLGMTAYDLENPRKGTLFLLQALRYMKEEKLLQKNFAVQLIGGYSSFLQNKIQALGLKNEVQLLGRLEHDQVINTMASWDIFVFPSLFEELSLATIEAMSLGLVCIGWDIDALREAWGEEGILLHQKDPRLLASTISHLLSDKKLLLSKRKRIWKRARTYFHWDVVEGKLLNVYRKEVAKKSAPFSERATFQRES